MRRKLPIFYSALLLTGVNLLLRLVSTSFQVYLSARLGAAGIGLLQLVLSVGMLAMTAGMAGVRTACMYLTAEELGRRHPERVGRVLGGAFCYSIVCSSVVATGLYSAAPVIAAAWIGDVRAVSAVRTFAVFLPVVCWSGCMTGYFTAANRIGALSAVEIAEQVCSMGITMSALYLYAGSDVGRACQCVVLGSGAGAVLTLTALLILRLRERPPRGERIPVAQRLLATAAPLALADDLKSGISTAENLMVPKRLALYGGSVSPLAEFGLVIGMVFPILMFPAAILFALSELLLPELARCAAAGSKRRIRYLARRSLRVAMLYGCLCAGVLFLLSDVLCQLLYHSAAAGAYLKLYAPLAPMLYCDAVTDAMTKGLGQQRKCVRYNILTSAMDVTFLFLLLPRCGMQGYFISFFVTHLINFILSLRLLLKIADVKLRAYVPLLTVSAALFSVFCASYVQLPAMRAAAFLLLFGAALVLLRVVGREDAAWLRGLFSAK